MKSLTVKTLICGTVASAAQLYAASLPVTINDSFGSDPLEVLAVFTDVVPGTVQVQLTVNPNPNIADLRGFFAHISNEALLATMSVTGTDVTDSQFSANAVDNLGGGANINPGGPYDLGIEIGTSGIGSDDFQTTTFNLIDSSGLLTVANFLGQEVAIRATSTGLPDSEREGSTKIRETTPPTFPPTGNPVPDGGATAALLGLGLLGMAAVRRK